MSSVAVPVSSLPRPSAAELRLRVEAELADRIPGALSPRERLLPEMASTGIATLDALADGWPRGTLSELFGPASSGRTSVLVAAVAAATARGEACALIDAGDSFDPESAAVAGVDLKKLLWIRCGKKNPPPGRGGAAKLPNCRTADLPHLTGAVPISRLPDSPMARCAPEPRDIGIWGYGDTETMERINPALARKANSPRSHEVTKDSGRVITSARSAHKIRFGDRTADASAAAPPRYDKFEKNFVTSCLRDEQLLRRGKYRAAYARIEQALKAADLVLGAGGFGLVLIDLAGLPPEAARRVPLTTWFRFRRAVETTSTVLLVVSPQAITQSCAALALKLQQSAISNQHSAKTFSDCRPEDARASEVSAFPSHAALLTGFRLRAEVVRSPRSGRKRPRGTEAEIETHAQWA